MEDKASVTPAPELTESQKLERDYWNLATENGHLFRLIENTKELVANNEVQLRKNRNKMNDLEQKIQKSKGEVKAKSTIQPPQDIQPSEVIQDAEIVEAQIQGATA